MSSPTAPASRPSQACARIFPATEKPIQRQTRPGPYGRYAGTDDLPLPTSSAQDVAVGAEARVPDEQHGFEAKQYCLVLGSDELGLSVVEQLR